MRGVMSRFKFIFVIFRLFLLLLFSFLLLAMVPAPAVPAKSQPETPPEQVPSSVIYLGDEEPRYAFLVDKSEQKMHLYQQDGAGLKRVKTFACATGENSGLKKKKGDKRTPEGVYFFTRVIEKQASRLHIRHPGFPDGLS